MTEKQLVSFLVHYFYAFCAILYFLTEFTLVNNNWNIINKTVYRDYVHDLLKIDLFIIAAVVVYNMLLTIQTN